MVSGKGHSGSCLPEDHQSWSEASMSVPTAETSTFSDLLLTTHAHACDMGLSVIYSTLRSDFKSNHPVRRQPVQNQVSPAIP